MSETLTCICCGRGLQNINTRGFQPDNGLAFATSGHYGSAYFDPMDGSWLEVAICDGCIRDADDRGVVRHWPERQQPSRAERIATLEREISELLAED